MLRPTMDMSKRHEVFLAALFRGRKTKGSGNQWTDQLDGKQPRGSGELVFAWDGKSTLGKTLSIGLGMWAKALDQTRPWETPMLALRFYTTDRLDKVALDLAVVQVDVLASLQQEAAEVVALRDKVEAMTTCLSVGHETHGSYICDRCGLSALEEDGPVRDSYAESEPVARWRGRGQ